MRKGGREPFEIPPQAIAIREALAERACEAIAQRLMDASHTMPLLSVHDFDAEIPRIVALVADVEHRPMEPEEREELEAYTMRAIAEHVSSLDERHRDHYMRWITAALDAAAERGVSPTELLASDDGHDACVRRMFSMGTFIETSEREYGNTMNVEVIRRHIIEIEIAAIVGNVSEMERRDAASRIERMIEITGMDRINDLVAEARAAFDAWIRQEAERIYGAMP